MSVENKTGSKISIGYNAEFSHIHLSNLARHLIMRSPDLSVRRLRGDHAPIPGHLLLLVLLLQLSLDLGQIVEPRVLESFSGTDAQLRTKLEHAVQKVHSDGVDLRNDHRQVLRGVNVEVGLVFWQL